MANKRNVQKFCEAIWETLTNLWKNTLVPLARDIWDLIAPILESVGNIVNDLINIAADLWVLLGKILEWLVKNLFPVIQEIWDNILAPLANALSTTLLGVLGLVTDAIEGIVNWAAKGIDKLMELLGLKDDVSNFNALTASKGLLVGSVTEDYYQLKNRRGGGGSFAVNSAGLGLASADIGNISLSTSITVNNNGEPIQSNIVRQWADEMTDIISENLGKRLCNV